MRKNFPIFLFFVMLVHTISELWWSWWWWVDPFYTPICCHSNSYFEFEIYFEFVLNTQQMEISRHRKKTVKYSSHLSCCCCTTVYILFFCYIMCVCVCLSAIVVGTLHASRIECESKCFSFSFQRNPSKLARLETAKETGTQEILSEKGKKRVNNTNTDKTMISEWK